MNETLAKLHQTDYMKLGLEDFGRPGSYFSRQISRWGKQYVASETESIPAMNKLMEWLPQQHSAGRAQRDRARRLPARQYGLASERAARAGRARLGDFDDRRSARRFHLSHHAVAHAAGRHGRRHGKFDGRGFEGARAFRAKSEYVAMYCKRTGRPGIENLDFYFAYNFFRIAGILQGIMGRVRDGTAASAHATTMASAVRPLAELGWDLCEARGSEGLMLRSIALFAALFALACSVAHADTKLIYAGTLFAVPGQEPLKEQTIFVKDGRIAKVEAGFVLPSSGVRVIDLRNSFVLPGLIDCHVHILSELSAKSRLEQVESEDALCWRCAARPMRCARCGRGLRPCAIWASGRRRFSR